MILDLAALAAIALTAALGARRGTLASGLALATLAGAYAAAAGGALGLGPAAAEALRVPRLVGALAAGTALGLAASLALALAGWRMRLAEARRRGGAPRGALDRLGGALLGGARGAGIAVLLGLAALWTDAWRSARGGEAAGAAPTPLRAAAQHVVAAGVGLALGDEGPAAAVAERLLAHPAEALAGLRAVVEHPRVAALGDDPVFWSAIEAGSVDFAVALPSFRALEGDASLRAELARLGLVDGTSAADPGRFRREMKPVLAEFGPRLQRLRSDPELAALAADPAVAELVARRDAVGLLAHPRFQRVLARALDPAAP